MVQNLYYYYLIASNKAPSTEVAFKSQLLRMNIERSVIYYKIRNVIRLLIGSKIKALIGISIGI